MTAGSDTIAARVDAVLARREAAAARAGRHPLEIRMVSVTKTVPPARIKEAVAAGLTTFGESYVQEALDKIPRVAKSLGDSAADVSWHLVGRLQRNKARLAVSAFDLIHSVDSLALAREIDHRAAARGTVQQILLEVNLGGEASKAGLAPKEAVPVALAIDKLKNIRLSGLMTLPPLTPDPEASRPAFRTLRELLDEIRRRGLANDSFRELSMGMSDDFEVAIEEGATWIRVGTAIFGPRPRKK
jgi:pyridoxal phosphate enzyme (YggS family)